MTKTNWNSVDVRLFNGVDWVSLEHLYTPTKFVAQVRSERTSNHVVPLFLPKTRGARTILTSNSIVP